MGVMQTTAPDSAQAGAGTLQAARWRASAFADRSPLARGELLAAPVRWPRPSRGCRRALELPGKKMAAGARALDLHTVEDLLEYLPRDSREARTLSALAAGEQATVAVRGALDLGTAGAPPRYAPAGRGARRRRDRRRSARRFFNQPWLVERYPPGTRLLLHGKADGRGGFSVSHHAPASDGRSPQAVGEAQPHAPGEGELGGPLPRHRGAQLDADPHARARERRGALFDFVEVLPASVRVAARASATEPGALGAMHFAAAARASARLRPTAPGVRGADARAGAVPAPPRAGAGRARVRTSSPAPPTLSERWRREALPFAPTADQRARDRAARRRPRARRARCSAS